MSPTDPMEGAVTFTERLYAAGFWDAWFSAAAIGDAAKLGDILDKMGISDHEPYIRHSLKYDFGESRDTI